MRRLERVRVRACEDDFLARGRFQLAIAVGFHNFNLRIFNMRVSNPNKIIVDAFFFDTMSDFNVPGSRPR